LSNARRIRLFRRTFPISMPALIGALRESIGTAISARGRYLFFGSGTLALAPALFGCDRHVAEQELSRGNPMLGWAVTFLIVALVAAVFGFGGIAGTAVEIAKLIFFVAIVLFAISAVMGLLRGRSTTL
jgi:uncharacterized membrane protein YtjA (UPF0391 family)